MGRRGGVGEASVYKHRPVTETRAQRWPLPPTSFVGRAEEHAELARLVAAHGLVTVTGPPGIGKTRLTLEWLRATNEDVFPGGVRFCSLGEATSADEVVRLSAKALGVSLVGAAEKNAAHVGATLASWAPNVLVLDNFEHVLDVAHPLVTAWRAAAPHAHIVVTSRERLKLEGEVVFELGPLRADAARLFVERAREVRTGYTLTEAEAPVVDELVKELDGNPLAIELAAARARVMSPKEILARMSDRFEVLVAERRGQPRRSALLQAIESSHRLLPPWAQETLAACAVFRDGFDLRGAERVVDLGSFPGAPPVVDVVELLTDKSLVARFGALATGELRFGLHASIRAFASQQLGERARAVQDRHARHYAEASRAWSAALLGPDAPLALDAMRADVENLAAALRHLVATSGPADDALAIAVPLATLLAADGPFTLRAAALEEAIALADRSPAADAALLVEALDASVLALVAIGRAADSHANAERAVALARDLPGSLRGRTLSTLALSHAMAGRIDEATKTLHDAVAAVRGDTLHEGRILGRLAWLEWMTGALEAARDRFGEALVLHRRAGDRTFEAMNSGYLAIVAHELGDLESPRRLLEHAIAEQKRLGHRRVEADLLSALGCLAHEQGDLEEALAMQHRALATYRQIGHTRDQASLLVDIGNGAFDASDGLAARAAYEEALSLARTTANAFAVALAEAGLGIVAAREGDLDAARRHFASASAEAKSGPRGEEIVALMRGHLELAEAKSAFDAGDVAAMNERLGAARDRVARITPESGPIRMRDRRLAAATLSRAVEEAATWIPRRASQRPPAEDGVLTLCPTERSVIVPDGTVVELERHPALWRLVEHFVDVHARSPGRSIPVDELVARGWPDERVRPDAGARRVYTALSTLRQRGLRAFLRKSGDGYALAPTLRVVIAR